MTGIITPGRGLEGPIEYIEREQTRTSSLFFFSGCTMQLPGSSFPDQGLNPGPPVKAPGPNPWTAREFPAQGLSDTKA